MALDHSGHAYWLRRFTEKLFAGTLSTIFAHWAYIEKDKRPTSVPIELFDEIVQLAEAQLNAIKKHEQEKSDAEKKE